MAKGYLADLWMVVQEVCCSSKGIAVDLDIVVEHYDILSLGSWKSIVKGSNRAFLLGSRDQDTVFLPLNP